MTEVIVLHVNDVYTCMLQILNVERIPDAEYISSILAEHFEAIEELTTE